MTIKRSVAVVAMVVGAAAMAGCSGVDEAMDEGVAAAETAPAEAGGIAAAATDARHFGWGDRDRRHDRRDHRHEARRDHRRHEPGGWWRRVNRWWR